MAHNSPSETLWELHLNAAVTPVRNLLLIALWLLVSTSASAHGWRRSSCHDGFDDDGLENARALFRIDCAGRNAAVLSRFQMMAEQDLANYNRGYRAPSVPPPEVSPIVPPINLPTPDPSRDHILGPPRSALR
jgi:hypothetical protein